MKMLATCRATVFSLMTSSAAIARFVLPAGDEPDHLDLSGSQRSRSVSPERRRRSRAWRSVRGPAGRRAGGARRGPPRARATHHRSSPSAATSVGNQQPGPRHLVRRVERLPRLRRPTQRRECGPGIAFGEGHRSHGPGRHRAKKRRVRLRGDRPELLGGAPCPANVPGREQDLDGRLEQVRAGAGRVSSASALRIEIAAWSARPWASRRSARPGSGRRPRPLALAIRRLCLPGTHRAVDVALPDGSVPLLRPAGRPDRPRGRRPRVPHPPPPAMPRGAGPARSGRAGTGRGTERGPAGLRTSGSAPRSTPGPGAGRTGPGTSR